MDFPIFQEFKKIPRLSKECVITEKLDGTNFVIYIDEQNNIFAGSHKRWLWGSHQETVFKDNHGFAKWVQENKEDLLNLGQGYHYGEFVGKGIQRGYGLQEKRAYLFNTERWVNRDVPEAMLGEKQEWCPECCHVVPILYQGPFSTCVVEIVLKQLKEHGSYIVPFMNPEGVIIYHTASGQYYKKTFDDNHKGSKESSA